MRTIFLFTLSIAVLCLGFRIEAQKLSADEIIAKHIQAVGGKEKLGSIKNRIAAGLSEFESKLPSKRTGGKAVIVGQGQDLMFVASFASNEYPFEKIGYFSGKQSLPFVPTGARSPLGAFLAEHPAILREGLFAGVIVRNWAVFDAKSESSKFRPGGTKKDWPSGMLRGGLLSRSRRFVEFYDTPFFR
jgi:hypothetical protein